MSFATTTEMAEKWSISRRRITRLCGEGRIEGAVLKGNTWLIPDSTENQMILAALEGICKIHFTI